MKRFYCGLAFIATFLLGGCAWFGSPELSKAEPGRTTFRAADENQIDNPTITPAPQKVPGQ